MSEVVEGDRPRDCAPEGRLWLADTEKLGIEFREGRAQSAPGLVQKTPSETKEDQGSSKNNEPNTDDSNTTAHPAATAPCNKSIKATLATDTSAFVHPVPASHPGGKRN